MTAMEVPPAHSGWTVTGQRETQQIGPSGQFQRGMEISFMTNAGNAGTVWVPYNQYTPGNVAMVIDARAAQLDAVGGLSAPATAS